MRDQIAETRHELCREPLDGRSPVMVLTELPVRAQAPPDYGGVDREEM